MYIIAEIGINHNGSMDHAKKLIHQAYKKEELSIFYKGEFFRDIIYIDDVIRGILTIIRKGKRKP